MTVHKVVITRDVYKDNLDAILTFYDENGEWLFSVRVLHIEEAGKDAEKEERV